jgi:hypothetical protein
MVGNQKDSLFAKGFWQVLLFSLRAVRGGQYEKCYG